MAIGKVCFTESPRRQDAAPTLRTAGFIFLPRCGTGGFILKTQRTAVSRPFLLHCLHRFLVMVDILVSVIGGIAGVNAVHHLHYVVRFRVQFVNRIRRRQALIPVQRFADM